MKNGSGILVFILLVFLCSEPGNYFGIAGYCAGVLLILVLIIYFEDIIKKIKNDE